MLNIKILTNKHQRLVSEDRVKYVLGKQSDYYGHSGDKLYGLVFVSRTDEAEKIAELA